jgi:general stress protein YciG
MSKKAIHDYLAKIGKKGGKVGGKSTSEAKKAAARENGQKGGRKPKPVSNIENTSTD